MKNLITLLVCTCALLVLVNAGFQSTGGKEDPQINFYGIVEVNGEINKAENITISGLYENIKMYGIPSSPDMAPTTNITNMRLDDIKEIQGIPSPKNIRTYQKRDYVEIIVILDGNKAEHYLLERARKLYYDVPIATQNVEPLAKEVALEAVKKVAIHGHKQRERATQQKDLPIGKSAAQEALCINAKKSIAELEKESTGMLSTFVDNIKETVYYLCG